LLKIKPSPVYRVILDAINVWQLDHPKAGKEECAVWLQSMWKGEERERWEAKAEAQAGTKRKR